MSAYLSLQPHLVVIFLGLGLLIALLNLLTLRRFDQFPTQRELPRLSVLVPARNEAANIEACIRSLLAQDYPDFEVLVLDDHSTDSTGRLLSQLAGTGAQAGRLRLLAGAPLPEGWFGKHWACHQLAQAARGELLLFTDADTRHAPGTLRDSVSALLAQDADLVTAMPREVTVTPGEQLIVPVIGWGILSLLPLALARWFRLSAFSVTIGQFMLFRRSAYESVGGHEAVRAHVVDDVMLGRRIIQQGLTWRLMDGTRHVTCRMYHGFWEAVDGFTKNAFAFFNYRVTLFVLAWIWLAVAFLAPPFVVLAYALGMPIEAYPYALALVAWLEALVLWSLAYARLRLPIHLALLYPLSLTIFVLISFRSLLFALSGQVSWKERELARPAWRW